MGGGVELRGQIIQYTFAYFSAVKILFFIFLVVLSLHIFLEEEGRRGGGGGLEWLFIGFQVVCTSFFFFYFRIF